MWDFFGDVLGWGTQFMADYGLWAIFILMFLETALILHGVPTEFIMTLGALQVMHSPADLAMVVLVGTAGATLGSQTVYWAAYYGGRPFILRYPRVFRMTEARLDRLDRRFETRSGAALVFACRLVPFLRGFVSIPAGLARMNGWLYFTLSTVGALCFNIALAGTTYLTNRVPASPPARFYTAASAFVGEHAVWFAIVLTVLLLVAILAWRQRAHVQRHYRLHMPRGTSGFLVVALLVGLGLSAILVAIPAAYKGLRTSGTPAIGPALVLLALLATAAVLAACRHGTASLFARIGPRPKSDSRKETDDESPREPT